MARFLLPLALGAAAFAFAWRAGGAFSGASGSAASVTAPAAPGESSATPPAAAAALPGHGFARREALLRRLDIADVTGIRRLIESGTADDHDILPLIQSWASQDPAGLWAWLRADGGDRLKRYGMLNVVFEKWFRKAPEEAIAAWRGIPRQHKHLANIGLMSLLFGDDAAARASLLPYLDELVASGGGIGMDSKVIAETTGKIMTLPPGKGRDELLSMTARPWMNADWKAATTWASSLPEPLQSKLMADLATIALSRDFPTRFDPNGKPPSHQDAACFEWARQWFTDKATPELRRQLGQKYVAALAERDPAAALAWAQDNLAARPLTQAVAKVLEQQAGKDPAAARAVVEQLPPGGVKQTAAFALVKTPTAESVDWLLAQSEKDSNYGWHGVAGNWSFKNPEAYKKYLESAPPGTLPEGLVEGGFNNLIRKDAPGTLDWALRTQSLNLTGVALRQWANEDAPAAAAWFTDHTAAAWPEWQVGSLVERYFRRSPAESVDWAATLPAGSVRDNALQSLRNHLAGQNSLPPDQRAALEARLAKP